MEHERRSQSGSVCLAKRDDEPERIRGLAAVFYRDGDPSTEFELWSGAVERIMPGAFDKALERSDDVRALFNHDPDNVLGRTRNGTLKLEVRDDGLHYEVEPGETSIYRDVVEMLKRGDVDGSSFAFRVAKEAWIVGDDVEVREIHEVELFDVGPVTYPAYAGSSSSFRSARDSYDDWKRSYRDELGSVHRELDRVDLYRYTTARRFR